MDSSNPTSDSPRRRSRTGCVNCRRKKKKCDEGKPTCFNCVKTSQKCRWGRPLSFLPQNAFTINEDLTLHDIDEGRPTSLGDHGSKAVHHETPSSSSSLKRIQPISSHRASAPSGHQPSRSAESSNLSTGSRQLQTGSPGESPAPASFANLQDIPEPQDGAQGAEYPFEVNVNGGEFMGVSGSGPEFQFSPDMLTDDGIFMPGSAYQDLHTTLRHHVFHTARSQDPSRQPSPSPGVSKDYSVRGPQFEPAHTSQLYTSEDSIAPEVFLDAHQDYLLWQNWVTEIADWLDKFDRDRHFGRTLPVMAKTCPHLRYSILALSARQLERRDKSVPGAVTLSLYSAAVRLLLPQLHLRDHSVLASCVVICVLEMMSCSPKAWRRHLDGCAFLIRSMGIRGNSTGVEWALFWCFARMDVCGGLISKERTLIPVSEWTSEPSFEANVAWFTSQPNVDCSASFACYLIACTIDLLFASTPKGPTSPAFHEDERSYTERWKTLFAAIEDWYEQRPQEMLPIVTQPTTNSQPFPILLYNSGAAISGNQLHHTAAMLMLQSIPRNIKRSSTHSILWHARRICGISIFNDHHGCWTNSIQPLWLAGQVMSHSTEHRAIVDIYVRIEKETGWGATWRAKDLQQLWGEIE